MPETKSNQKIIEDLKKENEQLSKEAADMRTFFNTLTVIKLPLAIQGKAKVVLECMVSNDIATKIKDLIDSEDKPKETPTETIDEIEKIQETVAVSE